MVPLLVLQPPPPSRPQLFKRWIALLYIHWINHYPVDNAISVILWIVIYPVDSAIHRLNNRGLIIIAQSLIRRTNMLKMP